MSQENADALRAVYEEWAKGNFRAGNDLWDGRVLFIPISELPDTGDYLGPEGVTAFMGAFLQAWTNFTIAAVELIEAGDSVVVVAIRFEAFQDRAEALEAVGLRE